MKRWESILWPAVSTGLLLAAWQIGVATTHTAIFPSPLSVKHGLVELFQKGLLLSYIVDSLFRVATAYCLALCLGLPVGIFLGYHPSTANAVNPVIQILRPISPLAWIPLSVIWFGVGNVAAIFLIGLASFFPIVVSTMNAVRNVPQIFLRAGCNFGLSSTGILTPGHLSGSPAANTYWPSSLTRDRLAGGGCSGNDRDRLWFGLSHY